MLGLFARRARRPQTTRIAQRSRLKLESLEARDCPSTLPVGGGDFPTGGGSGGGNFAPYLVATYVHGPNRTVIVEGAVCDEEPAGLTVYFNGVAEGSATTRADGTFTASLPVSAFGWFYAQTWDRHGAESNVQSHDVQNMIPEIEDFRARFEYGNWIIEGWVDDDCPYGLSVQFDSSLAEIDGQSAGVDSAYNTFTLCVALAETASGSVTAWVTDWWGETSQSVTIYLG